MPRKPRHINGDVGVFHVFNRSTDKKIIFHDDDDYLFFRHLVFEAKKKFKLQIYYYVWMPNHYHLLLKNLAAGNLSKAMQSIGHKYSLWHQRKYGGVGHLWQNRFKSKPIRTETQFAITALYIESNPVKDQLCDDPKHYRWSSYAAHTTPAIDWLVDRNWYHDSLGPTERKRREAHVENINQRLFLTI